MTKDGVAEPVTCHQSQKFKLGFYRYYFKVLRSLGIKISRFSLGFNHGKLVFYLPTAYSERALWNAEHVLVDCDYFQVVGAIPRPGDTVVDVGAFLGFYTAAASFLVGNEGKVYSLEPNKLVYPVLVENIHLNGFSAIHVYPLAVCPERGLRKLYVGEYPAVSSLSRDHVERYTVVERELEVRCIKLSSLLKYIGYLDILKLDIEGLEREVLKEALGELTRTNTLVVEVHTDTADQGEVERVLGEAGFNRLVVYASSEMPHQVVVYAFREPC